MADRLNRNEPVEILTVEDNPGEVRLIREVLRDGKVPHHLHVVGDGVEALKFLRKEGEYAKSPRVDLVLLDLNLPKKDGREVLQEIKLDRNLRRTPVIVLSTSQAEEDILRTYELNANCYIIKPMDLDQFTRVVKAIEEFWFNIVQLPGELNA